MKIILEKHETTYRAALKVSNYDYLEVVQGEGGRITIKFLDVRWRTIKETQEMLKQIIEQLSTLPNQQLCTAKPQK